MSEESFGSLPWTFGTQKDGCRAMEAVVEQARTTRKLVHVQWGARRENFHTRSKGPIDELIERTYDDVIASRSLQGKVKNMDMVEDFESRPHKAVTFLVERDNESR